MQSRLQNASAQKITPYGKGVAYIEAARAPDSRRIDLNDWYQSELRTVVVSEYTEQQYQKGESRYLNGIGAGQGKDRACVSCHVYQSNAAGTAPSHQIGRITGLSDEDALKWITTGSVGEGVAGARIADDETLFRHAWNFSDEVERIGTVAYLRSLQTKDVAELTRIKFEESMAAE